MISNKDSYTFFVSLMSKVAERDRGFIEAIENEYESGDDILFYRMLELVQNAMIKAKLSFNLGESKAVA